MKKCIGTHDQAHSGGISIFLLISIFLTLVRAVPLADETAEIATKVDTNATFVCSTRTERILWTRNGKNITKSDKRFIARVDQINDDDSITDGKVFFQELAVARVTLKDLGNYSCIDVEDGVEKRFFLQPIIQPKIVAKSNVRIRTNMTKNVTLFCLVEAFPPEEYKSSIEWRKEDVDGMDFAAVKEINLNLSNKTRIQGINETRMNVTLSLENVSKRHNGTYTCRILIPRTGEVITGSSSIFVLDRPEVRLDFVKAVGANKIFMNWTVNDGNDPIQEFYIQYRKEGDEIFTYYKDRIKGKNQSCVLENFDPLTSYQFKILAQNKIAMGPAYTHPTWVKTLEKDPVFIPTVEVKGNTHSTITIGWTPPPPELLEYIQYYDLVVVNVENASEVKEAIHLQNSRNLPYMFDGLRTASEYNFRVRACSELTKECGNWSEPVMGTTMDGISSEPVNLHISCIHYNISRRNSVEVTWEPPMTKNGKIISYHVVLSGVATFRSDQMVKNETWGPKTKSIDEKSYRAIYEGIPPNTNYTVQVQAVTRSKKPGVPSTHSCIMPPTVPDAIGKFLWGKVKTETNDWVFKLNLPRISERNGPICCYRIYLVRVSRDEIVRNLPPPEDLDVMSYQEAHAVNNSKGGAYIAEIMTGENFHSEIFLGDGKRMNGNVSEEEQTEACRRCLEGIIWRSPARKRTTVATTTTTTPKPILPEDISTLMPVEVAGDGVQDTLTTLPPVATSGNRRRRRRQHLEELRNAMLEDKPTTAAPQMNEAMAFSVFDGQLDLKSEYTGFVEVIVKNRQDDKDQVLSSYSEYFQMMPAGAPPNLDDSSDNMTYILALVVQILLALIVIVLILLMSLCIVHRYYTKNVARGEEGISLRESLRALCGGRTQSNHHRHLIGTQSSKPPDIPPIPKVDMTQAYVTRHKDSDYGFQHEFEMLPDRFSDRTTKNSDAKENSGKNRYPDIKAYDQTRVKLSTINSIIGSDYINANFILGYKERKKFICAQGPMDGTVNDFWRMIWEQHLEIIVMLTNLEEYNKTKCAKYWPEKVNDVTQFGEIGVTFVSEERFSDYLVRELKVVKRGYEDEEDRRYITQYHYLMWKDFMAPEHPQGIVKFIKQINNVYSLQRGPILVHCSAGVGRTGTLVALDSLLQQLDEEGHVAIFNTVCDMRHQRNFLVQSLKQYIFLYRALMEVAQFGSTELPWKGLGAAVETLKTRQDGKEQCQLEVEFAKIKSSVDDTKKTCAVASGEENRCKNRSDSVLPFDRNRVILTPIPGREHSTYINASFIEGYDNAESFIIAQDPLEGTIGDFWRMVSEQSINTLVMLSEIGDGPKKSPRYWADDEIQYDHIAVKYIQSESCPYYTRREFNVTNVKIDDTIHVTQFQYNGWPTVDGEVPEVCRGIIELVDQALKHHNSQKAYSQSNPIAVHCSLGSDRSSIFVAMCFLVEQLRAEKRVDICTTVRKLRSQRNVMIDTYAQYEFLHRAIVNYADLHRVSLDSPSD